MNKPPLLKLVLTTGFCMLLFGCTTIPTTFETNSTKDPEYDLSTLKTYSWIEDAKSSVPRLKNTELIQTYTPGVIDKNLQSKGYQFNKDPIKADVVVSFHVTSEETVRSSDLPTGVGMDAKTAALFHAGHAYTRGTLIITFLSVSKKAVVWRGTASTPITPGYDPAAVKEILNHAVAAVLKQLPSRK